MSFPPESQAPDTSEADYLQMIQRFDQMWASACTEHAQAEMQRLLHLIEQYEAKNAVENTEQNENRDSGMRNAPENPGHRQGLFQTATRSTQ